MTTSTSAFDLPGRLAAKADPGLVSADEAHFAALAESLAASIADLEQRLDAERRIADREGQAALDKDLEVHRLSARLRTLRRFTLDLCLGRMVAADGTTTYVGRLGLTDRSGRRLLVDWRSPAAEPFFAATHAHPLGLASRRRYRWTLGRITDYWDEVFTPDGLESQVALDDQSAFIASLGASRSDRMRDVLGTIQADQDAIVRAGARGTLVVDGGPGTGKTVVALHRTAYLLYADPRLQQRRGGVLFVGPHEPYLAYVGDVLPSLGEEGVRTCTLRDLVPEGREAVPEADPEVARLKASAAMVAAIEPAVTLYEEPPTGGMEVETPWSDVWLGADDWADAFASPDPGTPHNHARDLVWEELVSLLVDKHDLDDEPLDEEGLPTTGDVDAEQVRRALRANPALREAFDRAWPLVDADDLVADLWEVPAYLRRCAPWLGAEEVRLLQRDDPKAWTVSDLPLLDAARLRLGDRGAVEARRRRAAAVAADRARMDDVVDDLVTAERDMGDGEGLMVSLRQDGLRAALLDDDLVPDDEADPLAGPFAHVVVDEAQELTDAEWQMLRARCPSASFTVVGDRAQARHGFTESWTERLARVGLDDVTVATLGINYRTPQEVMAEAEPVIRAALPDANVPTSVRSSGIPVARARLADLDDLLAAWLAEEPDGTACVIAEPPFGRDLPERVRLLTPGLAKGLEFDLVVLVDPASYGGADRDRIEGAVDRYVAMTRATQRLVVLTGD